MCPGRMAAVTDVITSTMTPTTHSQGLRTETRFPAFKPEDIGLRVDLLGKLKVVLGSFSIPSVFKLKGEEGTWEYADRLSPSYAPSSGPALHSPWDPHKEGL